MSETTKKEKTMESITEEEKSAKILKAEEKLRQAKVELRRTKNEEKKKLRQKQNNHKYLRQISDRATLKDPEFMKEFIRDFDIKSFSDIASFKITQEPTYNELFFKRQDWHKKVARREALLEAYEKYAPYIKIKKESNSLKGWAKRRFDAKHIPELTYYDLYKSELKQMLYPNENITPQRWRSELKAYKAKLDETKKPFVNALSRLAAIEVLEYNRKELNRMLENERSKDRGLSLGKSKDNLSL